MGTLYSNEPTKIIADWIRTEDYVFEYLENAISEEQSDDDKNSRIMLFIKSITMQEERKDPAWRLLSWTLSQVNCSEIKRMFDGV